MRSEGFAHPWEQITFCMPHLIFRDRQGISRQTSSLASRPHCPALYNTRRLQSCCGRVVHALVGFAPYSRATCTSRPATAEEVDANADGLCPSPSVHCLIETAIIYAQANVHQFSILTSGGTR